MKFAAVTCVVAVVSATHEKVEDAALQKFSRFYRYSMANDQRNSAKWIGCEDADCKKNGVHNCCMAFNLML